MASCQASVPAMHSMSHLIPLRSISLPVSLLDPMIERIHKELPERRWHRLIPKAVGAE